MGDAVRITTFGDHPHELVGDTEVPFRLRQQHHASVRSDPSASKAALTFLRAIAGRSKGSGISSSTNV
jgi:hypothetical protein